MKILKILLALNLTLFLFFTNTETLSAKENILKGSNIELGPRFGIPNSGGLLTGVAIRIGHPVKIEKINFDFGLNGSFLPVGVPWGGPILSAIDFDSRFYLSEGHIKFFLGPHLGAFLGFETPRPYIGLSTGAEFAFNEHWGSTLKIDVLAPAPLISDKAPASSVGLNLRYIL